MPGTKSATDGGFTLNHPMSNTHGHHYCDLGGTTLFYVAFDYWDLCSAFKELVHPDQYVSTDRKSFSLNLGFLCFTDVRYTGNVSPSYEGRVDYRECC